MVRDCQPEACHLRGEFSRARGSLASPERNVGRRAMGIFHPYLPHLDTLDPPRRIAQQHDVAGQTLHGKVFIHRSHNRAIRFRHLT